MFRLHRHKPEKSGERIDFKFSQFQAVQVPKGWDKLFVSIISVETGKTIAKSSKALVRNGNCQWSESLSESIWVSQDDTSKELEECHFKLVVSMGSARSGILGEAIVNLTNYTSSRNLVPVSLPLKKCNYGTSLQVKIQCLTPRTKFRETTSNLEDQNIDYDDMDTKSDGSDNMFNRSVGSSSSNHLGGTSYPREHGSRDMSFSGSGSRHSSDSGEGSVGKTNFSSGNNSNGDMYNLIRRQDSAGSQNSAPFVGGPGNDLPRSSPSSFNSGVTGSATHLQNQWQEFTGQSPSHALAPLSLRPVDSSKDLLEAAEDTIEELRAEAKMWERNARKLKLDLELLRKEFSDQSRCQADLDVELSAANAELERLKMENEQLQLSLEESVVTQTATGKSKFQAEEMTRMQKELEDEIKFQKESNNNLTVQMKKTQESNIELVSVLQELEETIEKQRLEMYNLSAQKIDISDFQNSRDDQVPIEDYLSLRIQLQELQEAQTEAQSTMQLLEKSLKDKNQEIAHERELRKQTRLDMDTEWARKLSAKEAEIVNLEAKLSNFLNDRRQMEFFNGGDPELIKEIEVLKVKIQELERDCNELTDENMELIFKMKESRKDTITGETSLRTASNEFPDSISASTSASEIQILDLQNKYTELEDQLQISEDKACDLDVKLCNCQLKLEKEKTEVAVFQQQLESYLVREIEQQNQLTIACTKVENFESYITIEIPKIFSELHKQIHLALAHIKRPWYNIYSHVNAEDENGLDVINNSNFTDCLSQKEQAVAMVNKFLELNNLLEAKIVDCRAMFQRSELEVRERDAAFAEAQKQEKNHILKENALYLSIQELESLKIKLQSEIDEMKKELAAKRSEEEFKYGLSLKEEEVEVLRQSQRVLEARVSDLQKEKFHLEENLENALRESSITSKCLDDVRQELMVLTSSMDSHVSASKMLERKSMELESGKQELETNISELEEENVQLSERISGLEAQLRYLTDERETRRSELENSSCLVMDLQKEIGRLGNEMETQKVELKQKLQETQKRWSEAQEESEYLKRAHLKLEGTVESFIEECNSLQRLNGDLRRQKLELHENCTHLEAELKQSRKELNDCNKKVELLGVKLSSMQNDISLKEKSLTSELEALLHEHKEHREKQILSESLLNQMHLEKTDEVENLQREVAHLTAQISSTHDERERIAGEAVLEASSLRADKAKLELSLQEVSDKVRMCEIELYNFRLESGNKVQGLMGMLAASKQNEELLMADHGHMKKLLEDIKSSEEKFESKVNELELKLKASEYERQQLMEEISSLKVQLQKIAVLQDEILALKSSLDEVKFEKSKLEESLQILSEDCEELKVERISFIEKISSMQKVLSEGEEARRSRVALEEKLMRLECDLSAKEALCAYDAELKNELSRIKRANSQFQRKIQFLEEEKDNCLRRAEALEGELKLRKEDKHWDEKQVLRESSNKDLREFSEHNGNTNSLPPKLKFLEGNNKLHDYNGREQLVIGVDPVLKIQLLETELAEALDANNMYKVQLKSFLSDKKPVAKDEVRDEGYEDKASLLETELKDMRERYFHMSLKFAEVEAEREGLVMKLKSLQNGKRWFS